MREPSEKRRPIRETVEDPVREFHAKTFTNLERSKVKVVVPESPDLECELVADLYICWMKKTIMYAFTLGIFSEVKGVIGM
jgi:hypothetical protein